MRLLKTGKDVAEMTSAGRSFHKQEIHSVTVERGYLSHHRQRGSDCTVLTATGLVNGEWQILTPYRIETPKPIDKKFCTRD